MIGHAASLHHELVLWETQEEEDEEDIHQSEGGHLSSSLLLRKQGICLYFVLHYLNTCTLLWKAAVLVCCLLGVWQRRGYNFSGTLPMVQGALNKEPVEPITRTDSVTLRCDS